MMRARGGGDDRGAIMVLALFLAVFAVAILYTVIGTAETVLFRERLQDSADSSALSSAVMHARSMNLLVLINLVMAALLAVLVTIKLIESIAIIGAIVAAALAWFTGGATLSAIPPLQSVQSKMHEAYEEVKDPIYEGLEALHSVGDAVKGAAPAAAFAVAAADIEEHGKPTVKEGVVVGTRVDLPVEDGSFDDLCGEAGELPLALTRKGLEAAQIPVLPTLMEHLESPMNSLTSAFSDWFCGDSDGGSSKNPPGHKQRVTRSYPRMATAASEDCDRGAGLVDLDDPKDAKNTRCEESQREEEAGKPDDKTGECPKGKDCSLGGAYDARVTQARRECAPTLFPPPMEYWYQERRGHVLYEWTGKFWKRGEPRYDPPVRRGDSEHGVHQPPCGPPEVSPSIEGYRMTVHPDDDVEEVIPVCSDETPPEVPTLPPARGTTEPRDFREVTHILGCKREVEEDMPIDAGEPADGSDDSKSPKVVDGNAALGDENFQIRALVQGDQQALDATRVVRLALWDTPEPEHPLEKMRRFGGFSVAQAEYFYDGQPNERDAWMWNMNWRARLRRFRLPEGDLSKMREFCADIIEAGICDTAFDLGAAERPRFTH
ncbi:MAG TPA: hypothetical protein VJN18_01730 [Polyangiaceae bacterium]|nr:hypothetical protein [Polyangiaceae bacterium]